MKEITILHELPIIFTRNIRFAEEIKNIKLGSVVILPDDAVLAVAPPNIELVSNIDFGNPPKPKSKKVK